LQTVDLAQSEPPGWVLQLNGVQPAHGAVTAVPDPDALQVQLETLRQLLAADDLDVTQSGRALLQGRFVFGNRVVKNTQR
jgi:hypothetical protein